MKIEEELKLSEAYNKLKILLYKEQPPFGLVYMSGMHGIENFHLKDCRYGGEINC